MSTALLLIDIQNDYFPGGKMELTCSMQALAAASCLLAEFRRQQWKIYHVQHISMQPGATFFLPETYGVRIHKNVSPRDGETVVTKHYPSSFRDTGLYTLLKEDYIDTLLICGMMTHMCVDTTVRASFDLGFKNIVVHDACATKSLEFNGTGVPAAQVQASYMASLGAVFAQIKSVDEILENMAARC